MKDEEINKEIASEVRSADQGDFFYAKSRAHNGKISRRPVFIVGKNGYSNDADVIVCNCTSNTDRDSIYDVPIEGMIKETVVRTNKLHTISRNSLLFRIEVDLPTEVLEEIFTLCVDAVSPK